MKEDTFGMINGGNPGYVTAHKICYLLSLITRYIDSLSDDFNISGIWPW